MDDPQSLAPQPVPPRQWYKKKRYLIGLSAAGFVIIAALNSGPAPAATTQPTPPPPQVKSDFNLAPAPTPAPSSPNIFAPAPTPALAPQSNCDPNYSGCVPIASDVDCAGGSGNGPAYVRGPIRVIGIDIYGLDRDGDGIGCE